MEIHDPVHGLSQLGVDAKLLRRPENPRLPQVGQDPGVYLRDEPRDANNK